MTERSYEDAVGVLKRRFGGRWDGLEADGRDEMIDALEDELGYDHGAATDAIDAMIRSGELRYHNANADESGEAVAPAMVPPAPVGSGAQSGIAGGGTVGMPIVPGAAFGPGHWQIGRGDAGASGGIPGRRGQVDPTA